MRRGPASPLVTALTLAACGAASFSARAGDGEAPDAPKAAVLSEEVLALFNRRCVECHGASKQSGKLRLDSLDGVFRGGKSGPAVTAGRSGESVLVSRIVAEAEERMPPEGEPLAAAEIERIRRWIDSGAKAGAAKAEPAPLVELAPGALPAGFAPSFAAAGDPSGRRFAVGRGAAVEVYTLGEEDKDGKAGASRAAMLSGPRDVVQCLAFSPDGKVLAAGEFRFVELWETAEWKPLRRLGPHPHRVLALAFSPDGKKLATASGLPGKTGEIKVFEIESGKEVLSAAPHTDTAFAVAWSRDGAKLFTGAADRVSYLLDAQDGKILMRLEGHTHHVLAVALSSDAKRAVSAGADGDLKLWNLEDGAYIGGFRGEEPGEVTGCAFSGDDKSVVSFGASGKLRVWDAGNRNQRRSYDQTAGYLQAGGFLDGGKRFVSANQDGRVWVLDLEKNRVVAAMEPAAP
jgi:mono/diheme cytochrome c family protein